MDHLGWGYYERGLDNSLDMSNHPSRENVYMLTNDDGERVAIIEDRKIYGLKELHSEEIAELFNGGLLPIVQSALKKHDPVA